MEDDVARRILRAFAELAVSDRRAPSRLTPEDRMSWVPARMVDVLANYRVALPREGDAPGLRLLVTRAELHRGESLLRLGWIWIVGHTDDGPVRFPLVSMPVRCSPDWVNLLPAGDAEVSAVVADPAARVALEPVEIGGGGLAASDASIDPALLARLPRLSAWAAGAAAAAGFPDASVRALPLQPAELVAPVAFVAAAVYLADAPPPPVSSAATLRSWGARPLPVTSFHHLYGLATSEPADGFDAMSPLVLDPAQRQAVATARRDAVTVVSGPPGTGKSQTVAAIALDAVAQGRSVLVAAPSDAAVDALIALLERVPGPDPVVFGSSVRRDELAQRLAGSGSSELPRGEVQRHLREATRRGDEHARLRLAVAELLETEASITSDVDADLHDRIVAPGLFDTDTDLELARSLLAGASDRRWWRRRRSRRSSAQLAAIARADDPTLDALADALRAAERRRRATHAAAAGGITLDRLWAPLAAAEDAHRLAVGAWLNAASRDRSRLHTDERSAIGAVATALRAGRAQRRERLGAIPGGAVARALPLWVGSLRDIDDLLPATPAMFDVVVIDEASQVDQLAAATALLRARRAVVVGDPRQLRHVSFLADAAVAAAIDTNLPDIDPLLAARLDVRRVSLFDAAASAAGPILLDQHYRSAPHLIEFSAREFYGGRLHVATRHPRNDSTDGIDVVRVSGTRDGGVNDAEVAAALGLTAAAHGRGVRSLGLVTPFREHADAIEEAVLARFDREELAALDLRVGTVHSFQGCERDEVIVSLALDPASPAGSARFVHDPNLFNVMVSRARRRLTIVTSDAGSATGLTAALLAHAERPPRRPTTGPPTGWTATVAAEAAARGLAVVADYPVGRGVVDLCVGTGDAAIGVECRVHADGVDAHIDHHLGLLRAGWTMRDAFPSRWSDRLPELIVELSLAAHS